MVTADERLARFSQGMDGLRGRLFEQVEALGLPERQEDAFKRVIRKQSYALQKEIEEALKD